MSFLPSCHEVGANLTEYLEGQLPLRRRWGIRLHLWTCRLCREVERAIAALPRIGKAVLKAPPEAPPEAQAALRDVLKTLREPKS